MSTQSCLPTRREARMMIAKDGRSRPISRGVCLLMADLSLWCIALCLVAAVTPVWIKVVGSLFLWLQSARLFIIGHDACHGSFMHSAKVNRLIGHIAFLPTLTPFSLWEIGHNVAHHGHNNLKGFDYVWTPMSPDEFGTMSLSRQRLERFYRSGYGVGLYYLVELWWKKLIFPSRTHVGARRPAFFRDCVLVTAFATLWVGVLGYAALMTAQSLGMLLMLGLVVPFLLWNGLIGFVIYIHHTHPAVKWYDDKSEWARAKAFLTCTVHIEMPKGVNWILHNIFDHTAHHVDTSVSLFELGLAQATLRSVLPERIVIQKFTWRWYFETATHCQLFDYATHAWSPMPKRGVITRGAPMA